MADWFKTYNDELDSKGMQFALTECPHVIGVWQVIKSEASKNRSSSFKWEDADFELIGFARKLNISVPIFNECLNLLERAKFISRGGGKLVVAGWDKMQSDYARGLDKGYYTNRKTRKKLASNSVVSTARGEESRREENGGSPHHLNGKISTAERISLEKEQKELTRIVLSMKGHGFMSPDEKQKYRDAKDRLSKVTKALFIPLP